MKNINNINNIAAGSGLVVLITTFFTVIPFLFGLINESKKYFFYNDYHKKTIILTDYICSGTGGAHSCIGVSKDFPELRVGRMRTWDRREMEGNNKLQDEFEKNKGKMQIWYNPNSNKAYFSENYLKKFDFITVWKGDLMRLFFNLLVYINLRYWLKRRKKLFKKIGLTPKEYLTLQEANKLDEYLKNYKNEEN